MQTVVTQGSPTKQDIVQPVAYDALGRQATAFLPYTGGRNGFYKTDALPASDVQLEAYRTGRQYLFYQGGAPPLTAAPPTPPPTPRSCMRPRP